MQLHLGKKPKQNITGGDMVFILYGTVCPRSSDPFYIVAYYIKWVTTSCTYSNSEHIAHA